MNTFCEINAEPCVALAPPTGGNTGSQLSRCTHVMWNTPALKLQIQVFNVYPGFCFEAKRRVPEFSSCDLASTRDCGEGEGSVPFGAHSWARSTNTTGVRAILGPAFFGSVDEMTRPRLTSAGTPFSSEEGTTRQGLRTFTLKPRPESGFDSLLSAIFVRQWKSC